MASFWTVARSRARASFAVRAATARCSLFLQLMLHLSQAKGDKMLVFEAKLQGASDQYKRLDEALRTGRFVRNMCLKYWLDGYALSRNDLNKYCKVLADNPEFPWVKKLNSMARQAMAERT